MGRERVVPANIVRKENTLLILMQKSVQEFLKKIAECIMNIKFWLLKAELKI